MPDTPLVPPAHPKSIHDRLRRKAFLTTSKQLPLVATHSKHPFLIHSFSSLANDDTYFLLEESGRHCVGTPLKFPAGQAGGADLILGF
jgi:hypothetical protein